MVIEFENLPSYSLPGRFSRIDFCINLLEDSAKNGLRYFTVTKN